MRKTSHPKSLKQVIKPDMTGVGPVHLFFSKILPYRGWLRKFISFLLIAFILLITTTAQAAGYDSNWQYRKAIIHNGSKTSDGLHIDAIHFFSHGADGPVQPGGNWLNARTLAANTEAVAGWGQALKIGADLLFYGCDLTSSDRGRRLMEWVAELTRADVAASADKTGHKTQGGDWKLEFNTGNVFEDVNGGKKLNVEARTKAKKTTAKSNTYDTAIEQTKSPVNLTDGEAQF